MRQNLCCLPLLFLLVCLAAVLVKSEKFTEIDENGNEIEVKRFYIEGRQVNGGNRQCVETRRRKRSSNYGNADENAELPIASYTAATGTAEAEAEDEDDAVNAQRPYAVVNLFNANDKNKVQSVVAPNVAADVDDDDESPDALLSLPIVAQITHGNGAQSSIGAASAGDNGIVIVHSNAPPKVNPQTHAIFELRPVKSGNSGDEGLVDDGDDDYEDLAYEEEVNPVSTTAIWSTGEDDILPHSEGDDDYEDNLDNDELDESDDDLEPTEKPSPKPKPKPTPTQKPSKKPSRKPSKRPTKKRASKRPNKSGTKSGGKPRPSANKKKSKRRNSYQHSTADRRGNHNLNNRNIKRNQLNNLHDAHKGTNTFTKSETFTQTGTANDQKDVNCIIINRTTTARPFWNIFGRSADGEEVPVDKPYGNRKRINFSVPA